MKNIILQHFTGEIKELEKLSIENIKKYAFNIKADYELILGQIFRSHLTTPCQKIYLLDKVFDNYNVVCMLDIDMFVPHSLTENVFDYPGIGLHEETQKRLLRTLTNRYPAISSVNYPYWGGAIYKMNQDTRKILRSGLGGDESWMENYNKRYNFGDEGIMHTLAYKTNFNPKNPYLNKKWCQCSFLPNLEKAGFIHIRTKITPTGPKREKIENLKHLISEGIIK